HVLSAALPVETAANERDVGQTPGSTQLAKCIDQDDRRRVARTRVPSSARRFRALVQPATPEESNPALLQKLRDRLEALLRGWHQGQPQARMRLASTAIDAEHDVLFRILRAAGDPDQLAGSDAEQLAEGQRAGIAAVGGGAVVLDVAGDDHVSRPGQAKA